MFSQPFSNRLKSSPFTHLKRPASSSSRYRCRAAATPFAWAAASASRRSRSAYWVPNAAALRIRVSRSCRSARCCSHVDLVSPSSDKPPHSAPASTTPIPMICRMPVRSRAAGFCGRSMVTPGAMIPRGVGALPLRSTPHTRPRCLQAMANDAHAPVPVRRPITLLQTFSASFGHH